jgi:hypothetical protein
MAQWSARPHGHVLALPQKREIHGLEAEGHRFESCYLGVLQLFGGHSSVGEHLLCTQGVMGSNPIVSIRELPYQACALLWGIP